MMKTTCISIFYWAVLSMPTLVFSQHAFISVGPELALPSHYEGSYTNRGTGVGGSFRIESSWSEHVSGMATIGYVSFAPTSPFASNSAYKNKVNAVPIQVGVKYYTQGRGKIAQGFFLTGELGLMSTSNHITYTNGITLNSKALDLSCAFGPGYQLNHVELGGRLQYNLSEVGFHVYYYDFRIAYSFRKKV